LTESKVGERPATLDEMTSLVFKLVRALKAADADGALQEKAVDYLKRKGLVRGPFRQDLAAADGPGDAPPSDWKLVPVEPTDQMIEEICCSMDRPDWVVHARQAWKAALISAPERTA
jgi:hypothetical protein